MNGGVAQALIGVCNKLKQPVMCDFFVYYDLQSHGCTDYEQQERGQAPSLPTLPPSGDESQEGWLNIPPAPELYRVVTILEMRLFLSDALQIYDFDFNFDCARQPGAREGLPSPACSGLICRKCIGS